MRARTYIWIVPILVLVALIGGAYGAGVCIAARGQGNCLYWWAIAGASVCESIALTVLAIWRRSVRRYEQTRASFPAIAAELGMTFDPAPFKIPTKDRPPLGFFVAYIHGEQRFRGEFEGATVEMFDAKPSCATSQQLKTVILFRGPKLPSFNCLARIIPRLPRRSLCAHLSFAPEGDERTCHAVTAFNRTFQVIPCYKSRKHPSPSTEDELRSFFLVHRLEAISRIPDCEIQSCDGWLLIAHRTALSAEQRVDAFRIAREVYQVLTSPSPASLVPIPVVPGLECFRQRCRIYARGFGSIQGGIIGFSFGLVAIASILIAGINSHGELRHPLLVMLGAFGVVIGSIFAGGLLGEWLLCRNAERWYHPDDVAWLPIGEMVGLLVGQFGGMFCLLQSLPPIVLGLMTDVFIFPEYFCPVLVIAFLPSSVFFAVSVFTGHRIGSGVVSWLRIQRQKINSPNPLISKIVNCIHRPLFSSPKLAPNNQTPHRASA